MKKSLITMLVALVLVAAVGVGATLAYLSDKTGTVTNTFTVGKVKIDLNETKNNDTNKTGFRYDNVLPGQEYSKKPVVSVLKDSEDCYLFVEVVNANALIELQKNELTAANGGWTALDGVANVYYREVTKSAAQQDFTLFDGVKIDEDVTELSTFTDITIKAYAVQKAGFDTVAKAWAEASKVVPAPTQG